MKKLQIFIIFCVFSVVCYAQTSRPVVSSISSQIMTDGNTILLSWSVPDEVKNDIKELHIFRTDGQFLTSQMLDTLEPIAIVDSTVEKYTDTNASNGEYYYAVVSKTLDGKLYDVIMPTINATINSVVISTAIDYAIPTKIIDGVVEHSGAREKPLANLQLHSTQETKTNMVISNEVLESTMSLVNSEIKTEILEPVLLEVDIKRQTRTHDDSLLLDILDGFLDSMDWIALEEKLTDFLRLERTEHAECRAWFYLGQIAYLQEDYRLAIRCFQYAEKCYPIETRKWITDSLMLFEID